MASSPGKLVIKGALIVNEGQIFKGDVFVEGQIISGVVPSGSTESRMNQSGYETIPAEGLYLLPGVIDDQVHFREPGLTYKGDIYSGSRAAVAGGITSFMEMPNTNPPALTQELLEEKYQLASQKSLANYSFYMGASNNNLEELLKTDPASVCGIKVFMGSSTGNMLVDDEQVLEDIFANAPALVAVHCEDEETVQANNRAFLEKYGEQAPVTIHPLIRSEDACYLSSSRAVKLAKKHNTRLHVLHLSTAREMELFDNTLPLAEKRITAEVCVHHLWFSDADYPQKGNLIKWNPAIKTLHDRNALREALLNDRIDVVATDHAPHTMEEKERSYFRAPSGGPMVQHSLPAMLELSKEGIIPLEKVVGKMCHNPAILFRVRKRGFIRKGFFADLVLVDLNDSVEVKKDNILYKCGWSPMQGLTFHSRVKQTFVNGHLVFNNGIFDESKKGRRLLFDRWK
ncbi:MAG: dihydroorotase [Bacteroidales bacterium]|nr:dihydroorotase [Bacteroidales bacterium]